MASGSFAFQATSYGQSDVTQPGDPLIASSDNSPGSETGPNAIDNQPTKYLNFDTVGTDPVASGFVVSPSVGMTLVTGLAIQSANDAIERDPKWVRLEGSNDEAPTWEAGAWQTIYEKNDIAGWETLFPDGDRFQTQKFSFGNDKPFLHYRFTVVEVQGAGANSTQYAEIELLGSVMPGDVTQPGDALIASSDNSPGSETGPNAIDDQPTKYLNFDTVGTDPVPSGFVVTPSLGLTRVTGLAMQSANDAIERDPKWVRLEGSNDPAPSWTEGSWEVIYENNEVEAWEVLFPGGDRFKTQAFTFANSKPFRHYRWTVLEVQGAGANSMQIAEVELFGEVMPGDVTSPGDALIASSDNSPGSETAPNAIDGQPTKYLNFDTTGTDPVPSGFVVTPGIGRTVLYGITLQSANDAIERDPKIFRLEGSNDEAPSWETGNWTVIYENDAVQPWTELFPDGDRFQTQTFVFDNLAAYTHYRWTVVEVQGDGANSMQIAEVELLGGPAPKDVTQPGDALIASSDNSPGSETAPNAIDNQPTKYLNFDTTGTDPLPSGLVVTPSVGATTVTGIAIQSANDAVERDPKWIRLEGSNDPTPSWESGSWEVIYENNELPAWTARFQTQEFYFENTASYAHYRFTVEEVQGEGANSTQYAEIELLAVTKGNPCNIARFKTQPVDTPVLLGKGAGAEFFVETNGPWTVQWYKNDEPISGAIQNRYTTDPVGPDNVDDVYTVKLVGCEEEETGVSAPALAYLLDPLENPVSIGLSFAGGGANGAPTRSDDLEVAGDVSQGYWNHLPPDGDGTPNGIQADLLDSLGDESDISVEWAADARWGAGTGTESSMAKLLNGLIEGGGAEDTPATITFSNVPEGSHSVLIYSVARPLEFPNATFKQVQTGEVVAMRQENADEYNPDPSPRQVTSADPADTVGNFVRFDSIRPVDGIVSIEFWDNGEGGSSTINAMQLVLNALFDPPRDGPDTDGDGLPDVWEEGLLGDLSHDGEGDFDGDGLSNADELANKVDPTHVDTDRDGLEDGAEVATHGSNPARADTDGDTLIDSAEVNEHNTDPALADSDGDGALDSVEVNPQFGTDPNNPNSVPNVIVATQSGPWMDPATWGGTAPVAGQKYAALAGIADDIMTTSGSFAGDSLTLIGATLNLAHAGSASGTVVISEGVLESQGSNTFGGELTFIGNCIVDVGNNDLELTAGLVGQDGLTFEGGTVDEPLGNAMINGPASKLNGDITIMGTSVSILSEKGLTGEGNVTLIGGGLALGQAAGFCGDLLLQGDTFILALQADLQIRDIKGLFPDGTVQFSLADFGIADTTLATGDLAEALGLGDDQIFGDGNFVLTQDPDCGVDCGDANADADGDGLSDFDETCVYGTSADNADTDGDGIDDGTEIADATNPKSADSDSDGLSDGDEKTNGTNPLLADTDGDLFSDGVEVDQGTDPTDGGSAPPLFLVRTVVSNGTEIGSLALAESLRDGVISGTETLTFESIINYSDAGDVGAIAGDKPFEGEAVDDFIVHAVGSFEIPADGTYSIGFSSDDGGQLIVDGDVWAAFPGTRGTNHTVASGFLTAGTHTLDALMFERGGGAAFEVYFAEGDFAVDNGEVPAGMVPETIMAVVPSGDGGGGNPGGGGGDAGEIGEVTKSASAVSLSLPAGSTYDVEFSTDLENWSVIATDVTGVYEDSDAARVGAVEGYYRGVAK